MREASSTSFLLSAEDDQGDPAADHHRAAQPNRMYAACDACRTPAASTSV